MKKWRVSDASNHNNKIAKKDISLKSWLGLWNHTRYNEQINRIVYKANSTYMEQSSYYTAWTVLLEIFIHKAALVLQVQCISYVALLSPGAFLTCNLWCCNSGQSVGWSKSPHVPCCLLIWVQIWCGNVRSAGLDGGLTIGLSLGNPVSDGRARNLMRTNPLLTPLLNFAREDLGQDQLFLPVLGRLLTLRM